MCTLTHARLHVTREHAPLHKHAKTRPLTGPPGHGAVMPRQKMTGGTVMVVSSAYWDTDDLSPGHQRKAEAIQILIQKHGLAPCDYRPVTGRLRLR